MEIQKVKHIEKVWGREIWMANTENYCGKKLILRKGKRCSMHYHREKDETFYIDSGRVLMELNGSKKIMNAGMTIRILPRILHRFNGLEESVIIETSTHHDDDDSYRIDGELSGEIPDEIKRKYGVV